MYFQRYSTRPTGRILAIETKQMEIEVAVSNIVGQVPVVLSSIAAKTKALGDLKGVFA
jgi:hypothetical protein